MLKTNRIPKSYLHKYLVNAAFEDGFAMLFDFESVINPDSDLNKMISLQDFSSLAFPDTMTGQELLAKCRSLALALKNIDIDKLVAMQAIKAMQDAERYEGIVKDFRDGSTKLASCTLATIGKLMEETDARSSFLDPSSSTVPSANRGSKKPAVSAPSPSPTAPPPSPAPNMAVQYPPTRGIRWKHIQDLIDGKKQCPICYSLDDFHLKVGCPCLAAKGKIIVEDATRAKAIVSKFTEHRPRTAATPAPGARVATTAPTPAAPAPPPPPTAPGARRATSTERASVPAPAPQASISPDSNPYSALRCQYTDNDEIPSDPDDDAAFDHDFGDHSANPSNTESAPYTICTGKARRIVITQTAVEILKSPTTPISKPHTEATKCCADSGATDHMNPDKSAFVSYHPTPGAYIELGDGTRLPQLGRGTAKFKLNGRVILLRNVLHVPALVEPLYSLRHHQQLPECGYYSSFDTGSHLLFPTFVLEVDTSVDNILAMNQLVAARALLLTTQNLVSILLHVRPI